MLPNFINNFSRTIHFEHWLDGAYNLKPALFKKIEFNQLLIIKLP